MATLSEALNQNKQKVTVRGPGGQLTEQSPEEIQQLSGQAGLQAPPTTAAGGAMLGANADQQKMMGTPAQKQAALSMALQPPEQGLAGALRRQQSRTTLTGEEQQKTQKNTDMQNLGNLGDRVTQFIDTQRQLLQEQQAPVEVNAADQFQGKDVSSLKQNLAALRADPSNMQLQLEVNQALGRNVNTTLSPEEINNLYESATDSIARGTAGNVDNDLTVTDLMNNQQFGYDLPTLSNLLGIPQDQIANLNVGQLRNEINRVGDEEFQKTQQLEQQAQSGKLGIAERGAALQAQREQSTTGIRATEADYSNLEQQISSAEQVQFGGKQYNVDDLLKDETISGIVKEYMDAPEGSEIRQRIDSTEPGLKAFIDRNKSVLAEAAQNLGGAATEFTGIQAANKQVGQFGTQNLDESLLKQIVPGFGELQANRFNQDDIPALANIKGTASPEVTVQSINAANTKDSEAVQQVFKDLSPDEFKNMFSQGPSRINNYIQDRQNYSNLNNAISSGNPQQLASLVVSSGDFGQLQEASRNMFVAGQLGIADPNQNPALYQAGQWAHNPDYLNDWMRRYAAGNAQQPDIHTSAQGGVTQQPKVDVGTNISAGGIKAVAMQKLGSLLSGNNTNGTIDFNAATGKGMSMYEVQQMIDSGIVKSGAAFSPKMEEQFKQKQNDNSSQFNGPIDNTNGIAARLNYLKSSGDTSVLDSISPADPNDSFPWQRDQRVFAKVGEAVQQVEQQRDQLKSMLNDPAQVAQYGRENIEAKIRDSQEKANLAIAINEWYKGYYNDKYAYKGSGSGGQKF